jgi:hypothetical protein
MPFIPFAATVGALLGTSAAVGGAAIVGTAAYVGYTASQTSKQNKAYKAAAEEANQRNQAAISQVSQSQAAASSQAQASIMKKKAAMARSRTIYTNPLGIADEANVAKKTLLGE